MRCDVRYSSVMFVVVCGPPTFRFFGRVLRKFCCNVRAKETVQWKRALMICFAVLFHWHDATQIVLSASACLTGIILRKSYLACLRTIYCFFCNVQPNACKQLKTAFWRLLWLMSMALKSGGTKVPGTVVQVVCPVDCWLQLVVAGCWYPGLTSWWLKNWGYMRSAWISQCWESA